MPSLHPAQPFLPHPPPSQFLLPSPPAGHGGPPVMIMSLPWQGRGMTHSRSHRFTNWNSLHAPSSEQVGAGEDVQLVPPHHKLEKPACMHSVCASSRDRQSALTSSSRLPSPWTAAPTATCPPASPFCNKYGGGGVRGGDFSVRWNERQGYYSWYGPPLAMTRGTRVAALPPHCTRDPSSAPQHTGASGSRLLPSPLSPAPTHPPTAC